MNTLCVLIFLVALVSGRSIEQISDILLISQEDQQESPQDDGVANGEAASWGPLQALMSINYENSFRVSVYEKIRNEEPDQRQFYYSPALIIDPSSAVSSFNNFTEKNEMTFRVLIWDEPFETFVRNKISQKLKFEIPESSVSVLPIDEIRIVAEEQSERYQIINRSISYINQPSTFQFRFVCNRNADCDQLAELVKNQPWQFVSDLTVYYILQSERLCGDEDNAPGKIRKESVKVSWSSVEVPSKINVLGSFSSVGSILDYRAEVYGIKKELLSLITTANSTLTNSTLRLDQKIEQLNWVQSDKKNLVRMINREKNSYHCNATVLRVTGRTVQANLKNAPNGTVCIGNTASSSPRDNFLVFIKTGSQMNFLGTQSLNNGFTDFTSYVTWFIPASEDCPDVRGCDQLPSRLRGNINGGFGGYCSKATPSGHVYLLCNNIMDAVVDDDGAITVLRTDTETLWY